MCAGCRRYGPRLTGSPVGLSPPVIDRSRGRAHWLCPRCSANQFFTCCIQTLASADEGASGAAPVMTDALPSRDLWWGLGFLRRHPMKRHVGEPLKGPEILRRRPARTTRVPTPPLAQETGVSAVKIEILIYLLIIFLCTPFSRSCIPTNI